MRCVCWLIALIVTLVSTSLPNGMLGQTSPVSQVSAADQTAARNAASIRAHHDLLNKGDWKGALDYFADDTKNFGHPAGRVGVGYVLEDIWTTFPDFRLEIVDLVSQGDLVIVRCKSSGTHLGTGRLPVNGGLLVDVPPTHKHFENMVMHWYLMRNGKIVDHYGARDDIGMMQQLGLLPQSKPFDPSRLKLPQDSAQAPAAK